MLHSVPRSRKRWLEMRKGHIGASEVAGLFGLQPGYCDSAFTLWQKANGRHVPPPEKIADRDENERMAWGNVFERPAARRLAKLQGWKIEKGPFAVHDTVRGMAATLDFTIWAPDRVGPGSFEIKQIDYGVWKEEWAVPTMDESGATVMGTVPPLHILLQHQQQYACSGYTWGAVGVVVGGNKGHVIMIDPNPAIITAIKHTVGAFWASVDAGIAPDVDASESTGRTLRAMFPRPTRDRLDLRGDEAFAAVCAGKLEQAVIRKAAKKSEDLFQNRIMATLGEYREAFSEGYSAAWTEGKNARLNVKELNAKPKAESMKKLADLAALTAPTSTPAANAAPASADPTPPHEQEIAA